jgi:phosphoserine phosphatase
VSDTIALIFDFDDTLLPDSTTLFLQSRGIDTDRFWKVEAKALLEQGFDPTLAYLNLMLDNVQPGKPLANLSVKELADFGATLDDKFYPGVNSLRGDLQEIVSAVSRDISVELYIVSGGLQQLIEGSQLVRDTFTGVYGCLFGTSDDGVLKNVKRAITFTEKTRYLFEINKGFSQAHTAANQYLVNRFVKEEERRVPFSNMIYVGDGLTDIPCFALLKKSGGTSFGIFKPNDQGSARRAFLEFLKTDRVVSTHSAKFGRNDDLGALLRTAVASTASQIAIKKQQAIGF